MSVIGSTRKESQGPGWFQASTLGALGGAVLLGLSTYLLHRTKKGFDMASLPLVFRRVAMGAVGGGGGGLLMALFAKQQPVRVSEIETTAYVSESTVSESTEESSSLSAATSVESSAPPCFEICRAEGGLESDLVADGNTLTLSGPIYDRIEEHLPKGQQEGDIAAIKTCLELLIADRSGERVLALQRLSDRYRNLEDRGHLESCLRSAVWESQEKRWVFDQLLAQVVFEDSRSDPADLLRSTAKREQPYLWSRAVTLLIQQDRADELPEEFSLPLLDLRDFSFDEALLFLGRMEKAEQVTKVQRLYLPRREGCDAKWTQDMLRVMRSELLVETNGYGKFARAEISCDGQKISRKGKLSLHAADGWALPPPQDLYDAPEEFVRALLPAKDLPDVVRQSGKFYLYCSLQEYRSGDPASALGALALRREYGDAGNHLSEIRDGLFMGSELQALDRQALKEAEISVIVNVPGDFRDRRSRESTEGSCSFFQDEKSFTYRNIGAVAGEAFDVSAVVDWIAEDLAQGKRVLAYDVDGSSSAAAVILAYLIEKEGKAYASAKAELGSIRRAPLMLSPAHDRMLQALDRV